MPSVATADKFLRENLDKYPRKDQVRKDIIAAVRVYSDLKTKRDDYYHSDGKCSSWVYMSGTIPVFFKGTKYNIPVCIWVTDEHPKKPPICLVQPTATMIVKPGKHVDANGVVYLPYLQDWKSGKSTLTGLIHIMCGVFGESPPVYSRPTSQPYAPAVARPIPSASAASPAASHPITSLPGSLPHQHTYPPPGTPTSAAMHSSTAPSTSGPPGGRPLQPQAMSTSQMPTAVPPPTQNAYAASNFTTFPPVQGQAQPPAQHPPYPTQMATQPYPNQPAMPQPQPSTSSIVFPTSTPGTSSYPSLYSGPPSTIAAGTSSNLAPIPVVESPYANGAILSASSAGKPPGIPQYGSIDVNAVKASLVSAVEEQLKRLLAEEEENAQRDIMQLSSTQSELIQGGEQLQHVIEEMTIKQNELHEIMSELRSKESDVRRVTDQLQSLDSDTALDIDEVVVASYPLHRQILNLMAEDNAIDDTIYYLNEGLRKGILKLDNFLKTVRELSSRQFKIRALISKAQSAL